MAAAEPISLQVAGLRKSFAGGGGEVEVLRGISLALAAGESLAVTGPSGSGKSTLLHVLGTLERPSAGSVSIGGVDPFALPERDLARFRNRSVGFVFQDHHLLPQYSVLENVLIPAHAFADAVPGVEAHARELLRRVGLTHRLEHRPAALSGGERQRAAIARALLHLPGLMLCDEPTGDLDRAAGDEILDIISRLSKEYNKTIFLVTHDPVAAKRAGTLLHLDKGTLLECTADGEFACKPGESGK